MNRTKQALFVADAPRLRRSTIRHWALAHGCPKKPDARLFRLIGFPALPNFCHRLAALFALFAAFALAGCSQGNSPTALSAPAQADEPNASAKPITVQTVTPKRQTLTVTFAQPGSTAPIEQVDLYAKVTGYVKEVDVDIGESVEANETLLSLDVPDLEEDLAYKQALVRQAEAEREQADAGVKAAQAALAAWDSAWAQSVAEVKKSASDLQFRQQQARRYEALAKQDASTPELADEKREQADAAAAAYESALAKQLALKADKAMLEAKLTAAKADLKAKTARIDVAQADVERTRVNLSFAAVKAPFSGIITHRNVDPGAFVNSAGSGRGEPLFTLARVDKLIVILRLPEKEAGMVRQGCKAQMSIPALDGKVVEGTVSRFSRVLDDKSRTMRVEIDIDNKSGAVYPGMYGPVKVVLREIPDALTVPAGAVYAVGDKTFVVQVRGDKAYRVPVVTGYDDGVVVQIESGLNGNEEIVVSNKGQLAEGQLVVPHRVDRPNANGAVSKK